MFNFLYPDKYYVSTYSIDFLTLYNQGIKAILFDIDNTLVPHNHHTTKQAIELISTLHNIGFKTCLVSNNRKERVLTFAESLNTYFIYKAKKPLKNGYLEAMKLLGSNSTNTIFIGDQLFTDIWGANNAKIKCYLVKPINKHEKIQIILKRIPEKFILFWYLRKNKLLS